MNRMFAVIALLMGGALQARWLQQPPLPGVPTPASAPMPPDTLHSRDTFDPDRTDCSGSKDLACGASILVRPPSGSVSARTLAHKPSKAALGAFKRGVRAWDKGYYDQALRYLTEAVQLDPDFVDARVDLGTVYAKTFRPEEALEQYGLALAVEPNLPVLHSYKSAALVMLGRWEEAEPTARRALQLDPESIDANYMLGIAMMMQGKITPETVTHLAIAAKTYPRARGPLAEVQAQLAAEPRK